MKKSMTSRQRQLNNTTKARSPKNGDNQPAGSVRIIGGHLKRRSVDFIDAEGLRPTPDRMRETLFNWLLAYIHGASVLDSCAGSGALGFEALSRGAAHCTFIEANPSQAQRLSTNAKLLHLDPDAYSVLVGRAEQLLTQHNVAHPFNLVFIDPPYAQDLWQPILTALITQSLITLDTLIYLEADKDLTLQLNQLADRLNQNLDLKAETTQGAIAFECLKQTKVGQVVAGLYRLAPS